MLALGESYISELTPAAFIKSVQSACRCHIFQVVGSLIPHPHIDAWEADQIKQQAMTVIIALKALQNAVTNMADDRKAEA